MDDFLEMEKLAYLSNDSNGAISGSDVSNNMRSEIANQDTTMNPHFHSKEQPELDLLANHESNMKLPVPDRQSDIDPLPLMKLQMRISMLFESKDADMKKILDDIRCVVQETQDSLHLHTVGCVFMESHCSDATCDRQACSEGTEVTEEKEMCLSKDSSINEELVAAISWIHDFVLVLGNEATAVQGTSPDGDVLSQKIQKFSATFDKETAYPNGCAHFSDSTSDPDIPHEGSFIPTFESNATSGQCSLEEFEQLKLEKDNMVSDLESTKAQLQGTEQLLAELKSQLASAQKLNSLAETQLKCMAESYKSLETRAEELQTEVNLLRAKTENLDNELQEERRNHQDALAKFKDLQEQLRRNESCTVADVDVTTNQERDIAAAAEKLAECQETIFLLGKQLKGLRPQTELMGSPYKERNKKSEDFTEEEPTTSDMNFRDFDQTEMDKAISTFSHRVGNESPMDLYNSHFSPSDTEAKSPISSKHPKHRPTKSGSSFLSSTTPEKHSRGFSRFFTSKGKNGY
ncbi:hypothetical protein HYC85_007912 [Camellia sinensis]|uniref:Filament-like plant protein 4 n=1 Tax=Camellia sinensis TaxID=4442 RepID=A0A7J7HSN8_CAMSI|nr:hypothetical protein HYC85_007912 [Camellia sinensis]